MDLKDLESFVQSVKDKDILNKNVVDMVQSKAWFTKIVERHAGNTPTRKSLRTVEQVATLIANAETKRQRKREQRLKQFN